MSGHPPVKLADLDDALQFVASGEMFGNAAWVCRETGTALCHSDDTDDFEPLPEDIDDAER